MTRMSWPYSLAFLFVLTAAAPAPALAQDTAAEQLSLRLDELAFSTEPRIGDVLVAAVPLLTEFYARRDFEPAWNEPGTVDQLIAMIRQADAIGLDPTDYHLTEIERRVAEARRGGTVDPLVRVELDLLLTESLARFGYHRRFGKVDPGSLDSNWNLTREFGERDPLAALQAAIDSGNLEGFVRQTVGDDQPLFRGFKAGLARYREIAARGGWPAVPEGAVLKPGAREPRVLSLRRRLIATGELAAGTPESEEFDEAVEAAVVVFQRRHGLDADGIVGRATLEALNVPVEDRIDQIRINLERTRWVFRDVEDEFLVVNIAGFEVYLVRDRQIAWRTRAQVGKAYRQTPVFKGSMKYLVFNPTWTVPPGILSKDVLPAIKRDRSYLKKKNMRILDRNGKPVDPGTIDWDTVTPRTFPYMVRQDPGPTNALGLVKFIFPNSHFVFLHDTPSRGLFERAERTFSSGCIRVDRPFELAELLLDDPQKWNREKIDAVIESGKTDNVHLREPLTVMLLYWTAWYDLERQEMVFLKDVYDRDARLLAELDGDFVFVPPEGLSEILGQ